MRRNRAPAPPARGAAIARACESAPWRRPRRRASVLPGRASARSAPACRRGWPERRRCWGRWWIQGWPCVILVVIPGWSERPDPESRDSGFALRAPRNDDARSCPLFRKVIGKRLAHFDLAELAGRGHRHLIHDLDELWDLKAAKMLAAMRSDVGFIRLR